MSADSSEIEIAIVVPVYQSAQTLPELVQRLEQALIGRIFEIVLVDDSSPDDSWVVLKKLQASHASLKIVRLLRNSGQHNALLCGLGLTRAAVVITMDDDLQHPPEEVPKLLAALDEGYDLAIGAYNVKQHAVGRNVGSAVIDALQRRIFGLPADFQLTSFRAVTRAVIERVVGMSGPYPYVTAMLLSQSGRVVNVAVHHEPRHVGRSGYDLGRSLRLALNLLFSYSSYPLYVVIALCVAAFAVSMGLGLWILGLTLLVGSVVPGWASMMVLMTFLNALILMALVIQGIYLSRLTKQATGTRVAFTIREMHG
jgi:polyisoprenyl-phosphate glycosyltransferase